ncbi:sensor histidine kinase [Pedobacter sp.]
MSEGRFHILVAAACILILLITSFTIFMFFYIKKRNNKFLVDKNNMELQFQNLKEQEAQRMMNQIGREIHDNIIQSLYAFRRQFDNVALSLVEKDEQVHILRQIADQIAKDAKNISQSLNSTYIKTTGLEVLIGNELDRLCTPKKIEKTITIEGRLDQLDVEKKLLIYRIAQDAILNACQHSAASKLDVVLKNTPNCFKMIICDNGLGIPKDKLHAKTGIGMLNMTERAKYINGQLHIHSIPGTGLRLTLVVSNPNFIDN